MTDKFEKWLNSNIKRLDSYLKEHDTPFDRGLETAYTLALDMHREFLKEQATCSLQKSNHVLGCALEAVAGVLEFRRLFDEAETLRVVAARLK